MWLPYREGPPLTLGRVWRRGREVWRVGGASALAFMVLADFGYVRFLLLERFLDEPIAAVTPRVAVMFSTLAPAEIDEFLRFRGEFPRADLEERFARGDECFVARHDGRMVAGSWASRTLSYFRGLGCRYAVRPFEVYLYDSFTDPAFRGLAIAPALAVHVLERLRDAGMRRVTIAVTPQNTANRRARTKTGFGVYERFDCFQFRGRMRHWHHAVARPAHPTTLAAPSHTSIGFPDAGAAVLAWKRAENQLRSVWMRRVPAPALAVVDPPLRRSLAVVRRAAALPLYLRQPVGVYVGACAGGTARVVLWGKPSSPLFLPELIFDGPPTVTWHAPRFLPELLRATASLDADLLIVETTPALAPFFRGRGFVVVPDMVRFAASTETLQSVAEHPPRSLRSDLRRIRQAGYRVDVRPYTRDLGRRYFDEHIVPFGLTRFGAAARLPDFGYLDLLLRSGFVIEVRTPDSDDPAAVAFGVARGRTLIFVALGMRDGDVAIAHAGAIHALYEATRTLAAERGLTTVDAGRCRPWRGDGIARYKWKHGYRPIVDGAQTLEHAVLVLRRDSPAARRLGEGGLFVRVGGRIRVLQPDGTLGDE
jgi:ribosomal protein S18 acetylase RimI-like enzyme